MASLVFEKRRDAWHVQFTDANQKRRALYLGKMSREQGEWWLSLVEDCLRVLKAGGPADPSLAAKVEQVGADMLEKLQGLGLLPGGCHAVGAATDPELTEVVELWPALNVDYRRYLLRTARGLIHGNITLAGFWRG